MSKWYKYEDHDIYAEVVYIHRQRHEYYDGDTRYKYYDYYASNNFMSDDFAREFIMNDLVSIVSHDGPVYIVSMNIVFR